MLIRSRIRQKLSARLVGVLLVVGLMALPAAGLVQLQRSSAATPSPVLITALYYDGYANADADDAFQLINVSGEPVQLRGWTVRTASDAGVFPDAVLDPGERIWVSRSRSAFFDAFGFMPDWVMDRSNPLVPALGGKALRFASTGGQLTLWDAGGNLRDTLVYQAGDVGIRGWSGPSVVPYTPSSTFAQQGQILYRKLDEATALPVPDTDTAADWAQDPGDPQHGRRVRYPGWDFGSLFHTTKITATATLTVAVGPDHLFQTVMHHIQAARESIRFHGYTLEHPLIAQALAERARAGVDVTLLLEDGPAGGITWAGKWAAREIEQAGGRVFLMVNRPAEDRYDRYRNHHLKVFIIDGRRALVGSENPGPGGMPSDDPTDGTLGHRGAYLITDAAEVVAALQRILDADLAPNRHRDILRWPLGDEAYAPPEWYVPQDNSGGTAYPILWPEPLVTAGSFRFEIVSTPENSLHTQSGLLGLVGRAGAGDTLYVQQLQEPPYWGPIDGSPATDPNVRLEAFIDSARRGSRVRILLDQHFDEPAAPRSNAATVSYVNRIAVAEGLDLLAWRSDLTGEGIHNKMVLAQIDGAGYVHVGSLNGSEAANKINREVALQVQSDAAYAYLAGVFELDWRLSGSTLRLPLVGNNWTPHRE